MEEVGMTVNRIDTPRQGAPRSWLAIALITLFAIATLILTRPPGGQPSSLSPLAGFMTLKASAQAAMPYTTAMANGKPTLIEFYADWCTTCQALAPTLQSVQDQFGTDLNWVMLNIEDPQWQVQVQAFQVTGVPHLALLEGNGAIADTFIGKVPKSVLTHRLQDLLATL
jgi:thiol-disulfide isomerase/thioredoxin